MSDDEQVDRNEPELFGDALTKAGSSEVVGYLGDPDTIQALLRQAVAETVEFLSKTNNQGDRLEYIGKVCVTTGNILLGRSKLFSPVSGWNEPVAIDEFCAKWCGSSETDPERRMEHAVLNFLTDVLEISGFAENAAEEEWVWQLKASVQWYVGIFMGVSPAAQVQQCS